MQNYEEIWKDIPNYEGMYQVSNLGNVRSRKYGSFKLLNLFQCHNGYLNVKLRRDNKTFTCYVHRLVLQSFLSNSKLDVNHKNGIKSDNRLENLEYCSRSENIRHAYTNGLSACGEKHYNSKLTIEQVKEIRHGHKNKTQQEISRIYNVTQSVISNIRLGKTWKQLSD